MASDAKACFSSKVEYHAVIRYLYLKGKTGKEIHGELADVYGSSAPSYAQVKFWVGEFKRSRTSLEDEVMSGRPLDATDEEMCKKARWVPKSLSGRPRWLSWMRRPTGDQEVAGSTPAKVGNILSWRLIMKYFLRSFSPFR